VTRSLNARIAALSEAEPALASDLAVRGVLIAVLQSATVLAPGLVIPAERVRAKLARGVPLLDGEAVSIPGTVPPLLDRLAVAWLADPAHGQSVEGLLKAIRDGALPAEQLLAEALAGHADHVEALAEGAAVSSELLGTLADLAVRPLLVGLADRLSLALRLGPWERGYCPIRGAWPVFAEGGASGARLRCGCCLTSWAWPLPRCPFCAAGTLASIEAMPVPDLGVWTVEACGTCRRYLKRSSMPLADRLGDVLLADLASWCLDRVALERGLSRPNGTGYRLELLDPDDNADEAFDDA